MQIYQYSRILEENRCKFEAQLLLLFLSGPTAVSYMNSSFFSTCFTILGTSVFNQIAQRLSCEMLKHHHFA